MQGGARMSFNKFKMATVVVFSLFIAGCEDPNELANESLNEIIKEMRVSQDLQDLKEREKALINHKKQVFALIDEYPNTTIATTLNTGGNIGNFSISEIESQIEQTRNSFVVSSFKEIVDKWKAMAQEAEKTAKGKIERNRLYLDYAKNLKSEVEVLFQQYPDAPSIEVINSGKLYGYEKFNPAKLEKQIAKLEQRNIDNLAYGLASDIQKRYISREELPFKKKIEFYEGTIALIEKLIEEHPQSRIARKYTRIDLIGEIRNTIASYTKNHIEKITSNKTLDIVNQYNQLIASSVKTDEKVSKIASFIVELKALADENPDTQLASAIRAGKVYRGANLTKWSKQKIDIPADEIVGKIVGIRTSFTSKESTDSRRGKIKKIESLTAGLLEDHPESSVAIETKKSGYLTGYRKNWVAEELKLLELRDEILKIHRDIVKARKNAELSKKIAGFSKAKMELASLIKSNPKDFAVERLKKGATIFGLNIAALDSRLKYQTKILEADNFFQKIKGHTYLKPKFKCNNYDSYIASRYSYKLIFTERRKTSFVGKITIGFQNNEHEELYGEADYVVRAKKESGKFVITLERILAKRLKTYNWAATYTYQGKISDDLKRISFIQMYKNTSDPLCDVELKMQ